MLEIDIMNIPNGKKGSWEITEFEITKKDVDFENMRMYFQPGMGGRFIKEGKFKRLTRNKIVIMSNTPAEMADYSYFIRKAEGDILINGLGLGCVLSESLKKEEVNSATVIELSEDVIKLVGPFFKKDLRLTIIHANALEWIPPKGIKYDAVWHDIWDSICIDNLEDMKKLHRKYGKRCNWQGSWCRELCEFYRNEEKKGSWYY